MFNSEDEGSVLINPRIIMSGPMNKVAVIILKDDGCNTNIVSTSFFLKNRILFERKKMRMQNSRRRSNEEISFAIKNGMLKIGEH